MSAATRRGFLGLMAAAPVVGPQIAAAAAEELAEAEAGMLADASFRALVARLEVSTETWQRQLERAAAKRAVQDGLERLRADLPALIRQDKPAPRQAAPRQNTALACAATAAAMRRPRP